MQKLYKLIMKLVYGHQSVDGIMAPLTRISGQLNDLSKAKAEEGQALSELSTEAFVEHGKAEKALEKVIGFVS
jgi:hypothetical protein